MTPSKVNFGLTTTSPSALATAAAPPAGGELERLAASVVLDPRDPASVTALGAAAQQTSAAVSDQLLAHVKVGDVGEVGALLGQLAIKCKSVDVRALQPNWRDTLRRLPIFGRAVGRVQTATEGYLDTVKELGVITAKLTGARATLLKDTADLNTLFDQNQTAYEELTKWIAVGKLKLAELDQQLAEPAADKMAHDDLANLRERLDRHVHNLELTATIRLQNAPKIRIVQSGNLNLAEKLQSSVLNTVPLWKENLALAITQVRQAQAVALQQQVDDTTNDLLRASADMLHDNSVAIAKAGARDVVDVATLQHTQERLLATVSEVRAVTEKMAGDRAAAREAIGQMTTQLLSARQS